MHHAVVVPAVISCSSTIIFRPVTMKIVNTSLQRIEECGYDRLAGQVRRLYVDTASGHCSRAGPQRC